MKLKIPYNQWKNNKNTIFSHMIKPKWLMGFPQMMKNVPIIERKTRMWVQTNTTQYAC